MDILLAKILSALVLWILSLCFGLMIPYLILRSRSSGSNARPSCSGHDVLTETDCLLSDQETAEADPAPSTEASGPRVWTHLKQTYKAICRYDILSGINCFCGGLFLGILLLELLPESRQAVLLVLSQADIVTSFPITEFAVALGLLLVMFIEHAVSAVCGKTGAESPREYDVISRRSASSSSIDCESSCAPSSSARMSASPGRSPDGTRSLLLIAMLSIHSVFEGLALGLQLSISPLIQLFVAISVHKSVLAFGLGLRLFESLARAVLAIACIFVFCTASPLGCVVGLVLTRDATSPPNVTTATPLPPPPRGSKYLAEMQVNNLAQVSGTLIANAILECLATGTFLYVTFIEVIPSEFSNFSQDDVGGEGAHDHADLVASGAPAPAKRNKIPVGRIYKLLILLTGFAGVVGLQFV